MVKRLAVVAANHRPVCERDGGRYKVGVPAQGCAFWEREPGTDDE